MKRSNLYIKPPASEINIQHHTSKVFPGYKAKRSEVPSMYRKSIPLIILKAVSIIILLLIILNNILFFRTVV